MLKISNCSNKLVSNWSNKVWRRMVNTLSEAMRQRLDNTVKADKVVVFMKGTQQEPMCGFSRNVKMVLDHHGVPFRDYNVLNEPELREGVKQYSEWPTIPQVYVDGQFVGGCDILVQMHKDGEITQFFDEHGIPSRYSDKNKGQSSSSSPT